MLHALEQIRRMRGGAQSHLMRCSDGHYYVVKFQNNPQHRRILVNELLGTRLAARLNLPTARVEIIDVSDGFHVSRVFNLARFIPATRGGSRCTISCLTSACATWPIFMISRA